MAGIAVLTAVTGAAWESDVVAALEGAAGGVTVVRRCVDVADLVATASSGIGEAVLLSADLRRLDRAVVGRLAESEVAVVGVAAAEDSAAVERLRALGVDQVVRAGAGPAVIVDSIIDAVAAAAVDSVQHPPAASAQDPTGLPEGAPPRRGRVIAVWGPCGAPGRTTVAVNLASEISRARRSTLLADADTYGASVAQVMGLLDEAPGLAGACRVANNGQLDPSSLVRQARQVTPELRVLTGITRTSRWPELRASSLDVVWDVARTIADVTVVDCGFCLEQDEELSFDTAAPRRNAATLTTLERADVILAVGSADPVGLGRLVRGLADLAELVPTARVETVVNRVRSGVAGPGAERRIEEALDRFAGVRPVAMLPDDPASLDAALAAGLTLAEAAPNAAVRHRVDDLARRMIGLPPQAERRRFPSLRMTRRA